MLNKKQGVFVEIYKYFKKEDAPLLTRQIEEFNNSNLKQISVGHNTPMMLTAIIKMMPFIKNNIPLYVSTPEFLGYDPKAIEMLNSLGVAFDMGKDICTKGDYFLDCSANLLGKGNPKGVAELTQSGASKYMESNLNIPLISIDDSKLKLLEDYLGTGEGFVRAIKEKVNPNISGKHFVIWGYGKVGKGLVKSLLEENCKCTVVEADKKHYAFAKRHKVDFYLSEEIEAIKKIITSAYCIVTCTGVKDVISTSPFLKTIQNTNLILANMGAEDEFGKAFPAQKILNNKIALNFALHEPTRLKYLDPVFYAHNLCTQLFLEGNISNGFNVFPKEHDMAILKQWSEYWDEDITDILET